MILRVISYPIIQYIDILCVYIYIYYIYFIYIGEIQTYTLRIHVFDGVIMFRKLLIFFDHFFWPIPDECIIYDYHKPAGA